MPVLDNPRHESLAQALAKNMTNAEAGLEAGYTGNAQSISDTVRENPYISVRVKELQAIAAERSIVKIEWLIEEWRLALEEAKGDDTRDPLRGKALENLSRHAGFYAKDLAQASGEPLEDMLKRVADDMAKKNDPNV